MLRKIRDALLGVVMLTVSVGGVVLPAAPAQAGIDVPSYGCRSDVQYLQYRSEIDWRLYFLKNGDSSWKTIQFALRRMYGGWGNAWGNECGRIGALTTDEYRVYRAGDDGWWQGAEHGVLWWSRVDCRRSYVRWDHDGISEYYFGQCGSA